MPHLAAKETALRFSRKFTKLGWRERSRLSTPKRGVGEREVHCLQH